MTRLFFYFLFLIFYSIPLSAKEYYNIFMEKKGGYLIVHYDIPGAIEIEVDSHYKNLVIKEKTFTKSENGKFEVAVDIKSEISNDFYDPIRVYSNGEFLLYKSFLFPQNVIFGNGTFLRKEKGEINHFYIQERDNYIVGERFVFFGKEESLKILGLGKNKTLEKNITKLYKNVFNYYQEKFGKTLKEATISIIDFTENGGGVYYKGDSLGNFLSYNISNVSTIKDNNYGNIYRFISHEIFHIWNSYEHNHIGKAWLHEGSAEYFALVSLFDLNYINKNKLESLKKAYLDACLRFYKENNKVMNENNSDFSVYICGSSLHILLEKLESKEIVVDIWRELLKKEMYNSDDFFAVISNHPLVRKETISLIYDFIYKEGGVVKSINSLMLK